MSGKHRYIGCGVCGKYPIRSDNLKRHMKTHEKKYGEGLRTQTVNDQMKWGYGLKSKHDVDERKHDGGVDDEESCTDSDTDAESETDSMDDSASVSESESVSDSSPLHPTPLSCLDFKPYPHFI